MNQTVKRWNHTTECPGCKTLVNPYVIQTIHEPEPTYDNEGYHGYEQVTMKLECPACEEKFTLVEDAENAK